MRSSVILFFVVEAFSLRLAARAGFSRGPARTGRAAPPTACGTGPDPRVDLAKRLGAQRGAAAPVGPNRDEPRLLQDAQVPPPDWWMSTAAAMPGSFTSRSPHAGNASRKRAQPRLRSSQRREDSICMMVHMYIYTFLGKPAKPPIVFRALWSRPRRCRSHRPRSRSRRPRAWLAWLRASTRGRPACSCASRRTAAKARGALTYAGGARPCRARREVDRRAEARAQHSTAWLQPFTPPGPQAGACPKLSSRDKVESAHRQASRCARRASPKVRRAKHDGRWARAYDGAPRTVHGARPDLARALARDAQRRPFETLEGPAPNRCCSSTTPRADRQASRDARAAASRRTRRAVPRATRRCTRRALGRGESPRQPRRADVSAKRRARERRRSAYDLRRAPSRPPSSTKRGPPRA